VENPRPSTPAHEVIATLREELLRLKIQRELSELKKKSVLDRPLASIVISFLLTGVLGVGVTHLIDSRQKARDLLMNEENAKQTATQVNFRAFSELIYSRYTRASLLYSALKRRALEKEIVQRKQEYDNAYYEWDAKLMTSSFLLRQAEGVSAYGDFETDVQHKFTPLFKAMDSCLTTAYDDRILRHLPVEPRLDRCLGMNDPTHSIMRTTLSCSYAVTDKIYQFMSGLRSAIAWDPEEHCALPR
jgi:hypothetical protein